jgi:hypothetical protein
MGQVVELLLDGHMNPFGIIQAALVALEGVLHGADPKRRRETAREQRRFAFLYVFFMLLGLAVVIWTIHSLYFAR